MVNALDLIDEAIANLEAKLNLPPGGSIPTSKSTTPPSDKKQPPPKKNTPKPKKDKTKKKEPKQQQPSKKGKEVNLDQPDICKLEFKVGQITKVWVHPEADKLYCEEIDIGEEKPRQIASGLRMHYTEEEMMGQRLLVVSNLKSKKLVGFPSHGMVLCAAEINPTDGTEKVEFIEPPEGAALGEIVTFEGLPPPEPFSGAQVEKKKVFQSCMEGMKTTEDEGIAAWNGHAFLTSAGVCRSKTIKGGAMR